MGAHLGVVSLWGFCLPRATCSSRSVSRPVLLVCASCVVCKVGGVGAVLFFGIRPVREAACRSGCRSGSPLWSSGGASCRSPCLGCRSCVLRLLVASLRGCRIDESPFRAASVIPSTILCRPGATWGDRWGTAARKRRCLSNLTGPHRAHRVVLHLVCVASRCHPVSLVEPLEWPSWSLRSSARRASPDLADLLKVNPRGSSWVDESV